MGSRGVWTCLLARSHHRPRATVLGGRASELAQRTPKPDPCVRFLVCPRSGWGGPCWLSGVSGIGGTLLALRGWRERVIRQQLLRRLSRAGRPQVSKGRAHTDLHTRVHGGQGQKRPNIRPQRHGRMTRGPPAAQLTRPHARGPDTTHEAQDGPVCGDRKQGPGGAVRAMGVAAREHGFFQGDGIVLGMTVVTVLRCDLCSQTLRGAPSTPVKLLH